jgi:hypothetical protein
MRAPTDPGATNCLSDNNVSAEALRINARLRTLQAGCAGSENRVAVAVARRSSSREPQDQVLATNNGHRD